LCENVRLEKNYVDVILESIQIMGNYKIWKEIAKGCDNGEGL
jgi:hypothetical protein